MRESLFSRRLLGMVVVAAAVFHVSSLLLVGLALLPGSDTGRYFLLWPLAVTAFLLSLGVVVWGTLSAVRVPAPPPAPAPQLAPPPAPAPRPSPPQQPEGHSTVINPKRQPADSPQTPADSEARHQAGWNKATTPWPRADEDDPNGTLIRPPNR